MKSSLIRSFVIFAAGAATAALAADLYEEDPPTTAEQFQEKLTVVLAEVESLGAYVAFAEKGRVGIYANPHAACLPPTPPVPNLPPYAVDLRKLEPGIKALMAANVGFLMDNPKPVFEVDKCMPVGEGLKGIKG